MASVHSQGWGGARALAVLVTLSIAALATPAAAMAALRPRPVIDLYTAESVSHLAVGASPFGDAVVGWTGPNNAPTVLAAFRLGDGAFAPVEPLSNTANGDDPRFVFEPDGTVLAVWSHATSTQPGGYATRPRLGNFGAAKSLPSGERFARVAIDAAGTALATWKSFVAGGNDVVVASRRAPAGVFEAPVTLSSPVDDNFIVPDVAVNGSGEAIVGWGRKTGADSSAVEARIGSLAVPTFGSLQTLASEDAPGVDLGDPVVAIATGGEALAAWTRTTSAASVIEYAVRAPGAAVFSAPATLASGAFGARIGVDPAGTAIIGFVQDGAPSAIVRPSGGPPGPVVPVGPAGTGTRIASVTFDAAGTALVAWSRMIDDDTRLAEAARRPLGGSFAPLVQIADMGTGSELAVAAEPDGDALAAWKDAADATHEVARVGGLVSVPDPPGAPGAAAGPDTAGTPAPGSPPGAVGATCDGRRATLVGTSGSDRLRGTRRRDVIAGLGGNDTIRGLGGSDVLCGGAGRDTLWGGPGNDQLRGDDGADQLAGGDGADVLRGGAGSDRLLGGRGRDRLFGGPGTDLLRGGPGRDLLFGGGGGRRDSLRQ